MTKFSETNMPTKTTTKTAARKTATARKLATASPSRGGPVKRRRPGQGSAEPKRKEAKSAKAEAPIQGIATRRHVAPSPQGARRIAEAAVGS